MTDHIKVGLIGCGNITSAHLQGYKILQDEGLLGNVTVTALCDRNLDLAASFRKKGEGPLPKEGAGPKNDPMNADHIWVDELQDELPEVYEDYTQMLEEADVNTVEILTPVFTHFEIGMAAIRAGKNVLLEKPLAVSVKAARRLVDAAKEAGVVLGVAESFHYQPQARMKAWAVQNGYIGTPQLSIAGNVGGFYAPDHIVGNTAWRHDKLFAGGGITTDAVVHGLHVLRYIYGEVDSVNGDVTALEPVRIWRDGDGAEKQRVDCTTDDTMTCSLRFENGVICQRFQSWAGHGIRAGFPQLDMGSKGNLRGPNFIAADGTETALEELFEKHADEQTKEAFFPNGIKNLFALEILDFFNAVRNGGDMETSGEEGLKDLALAFSILESSYLGTRVKFNDVLEGRTAAYEEDINRNYSI